MREQTYSWRNDKLDMKIDSDSGFQVDNHTILASREDHRSEAFAAYKGTGSYPSSYPSGV